MPEGKEFHDVEILFSTVCGFIDQVTGQTPSPKMTRVVEMSTSVINILMSCNRSQEWTREELRAFGLEMCEFKKGLEIVFFHCAHQSGYS